MGASEKKGSASKGDKDKANEEKERREKEKGNNKKKEKRPMTVRVAAPPTLTALSRLYSNSIKALFRLY